MTGQELFNEVCGQLESRPGVGRDRKNGFGSGIRSRGKVFAMLQGGCLIVKLPSERIAQLVASGEGRPHVQGGRTSKQWMVVDRKAAQTWLPLAEEALEHLNPES